MRLLGNGGTISRDETEGMTEAEKMIEEEADEEGMTEEEGIIDFSFDLSAFSVLNLP